MKRVILYGIVLLLCGCDLIEYHPYDVRLHGETGVNAKNIARIEEICEGKDTLRFVLMGDSQRWYDETEDFVNALNKRNDVDFVIHGGDISDFGLTKEFMWVRDIMGKPIAANLADGEEFCRLAMQAKTHVLVAHILRYNESYRRIRALIQSGVIGDVKVIRMTQNHHALNWPRYKRLLADCSPVLDCGVHYYDIIQWFTGARITRVQGIGTVIDNDLAVDQVNYGLVSMQLSNGAIAYYEAGWSQNCSSSNVKEFIGDKGRITLTMKNFRCTHVEEGDCIEVYHNDTDCYETMNVQANYKNMWEQLKALIDLIEGRETDAPTIADIHSAFLVGMAADAAIRNNTAVTVGR